VVAEGDEFAKWSAGVEAMMAAFWSPTENLHAGRQLVFGYIRLPSPRPRYIMAVRHHFAAYCHRRMLRVGRVFIDDGVPDSTELDRPAFAQLCQVMRREQPHGVLVLHPRDLSREPAVALELAERIWTCGAQVYTVRGAPPLPGQPPKRS
jgi:hypothetical protein